MRMITKAVNGLATLAASSALLSGAALAQVPAGNNMSFSGQLVAQPCTLAPADARRELRFPSVPILEMYRNGRSVSQPITLHLQDCNISEGRTAIKIRFVGNMSAPLPGHLALDPGGAAGVAIGLETQAGVWLAMDRTTSVGTLEAGINDIVLHAYLKGEPDALKDRTITEGTTNATVTFAFSYE